MRDLSYVAVIGDSPEKVKEYFYQYLISMGDPLTSPSWSLYSIVKHMKKILKYKDDAHKLYIDSGGYQIIVGYVERNRVKEFIDAYHFCLNKFANDIDYIFSLDVNEPGKMTEEELYKFNHYSIKKSILTLERIPQLQNKQIFVWQTRNPIVYKVWNQIYAELNPGNVYKRWAFGGLVGFKTQARANFSPFVPSFLDFMVKKEHDNLTVEHVHFLGQSSMLAILTAALLQHIFDIPKVTLDSSELVRHTPLEQKLPIFCFEEDGTCEWLTKIEDLDIPDEEKKYILQTGRMTDSDVFIRTMAKHIHSLITFADTFIDEIYKDILSMTKDKFLTKWQVLGKGRFYDEFLKNIELIHEWLPLIEKRDVRGSATKYTNEILTQYASY